jgi:hypothetical protein
MQESILIHFTSRDLFERKWLYSARGLLSPQQQGDAVHRMIDRTSDFLQVILWQN